MIQVTAPAHKKIYYFLLFLIFSFALFLRFYRLADIPNVMLIDESALGYNAWCIANYKIDRYFNHMPVYPQNFYGGQSPLYTYLVVLLIKTIGNGSLSPWLVRLPGALFSMLVVFFGAMIISLVYERLSITLMSAFLLAACPYFIMHGRCSLDCNLMLGCSTVALYLLIKYIKSNKLHHMILYSVAFGIVMYSYALSYFVVPIFLCLVTLYMLWCKKITFRRAVLSAVCVCITALPILLFIYTLLFQIPNINFLGFTIKPVAQERMADISFSNFRENVCSIIKLSLFNSSIITDSVDKFYTMYFISIPFIILGFFTSCYRWVINLKFRTLHPDFIFFSFYISGLFTIGLCGSIYINRVNYFFIAYLYFLVCGIVSTYKFVRSYRLQFLVAIGLCYLIWAAAFVRYYFTVYSPADIIQYPNSYYLAPASDVIEYAEIQLNAVNIYIDYVTCSEFHSFFSPISPYEIQKTSHDGGYGKYYFSIGYYTELVPGNAYISHKGNREFLMHINESGYAWQCIEYPYYYLFYLPPAVPSEEISP